MKFFINHKFRPVAAPLITVDPYFSIWSFNDNLYDDYTRHWSGKLNPMLASVIVDGRYYRLMGVECGDYSLRRNRCGALEQKSVTVTPLNTIYIFENDIVRVTLNFMTPLILDRLDILSRPVSYIDYNVEVLDGAEHKTEFLFAISSQCCVNDWKQNVVFGKTANSVYCGNVVQNVLSRSGDRVCIEWGYLHIADTSAIPAEIAGIDSNTKDEFHYHELDIGKVYNAFGECPYLLVKKQERSGVITLAYDEVKSIEYFGDKLDEYYKGYFAGFNEMLTSAVEEYRQIKQLADEFDARLMADTAKFSPEYEKITSLAYRQVIAAHKLARDMNGELLFMSKECSSNGCIATLDVTYPSIPLFLKYNPELVPAMLRPILKYAQSDEWKYDFAPHDVGYYPIANGQVYGDGKILFHMPVEECGNMLLCIAAHAKYSGSADFANQHRQLLATWVNYLCENGYNPKNQLCTDDFAGHLSGNCNLSLKAITAIGAYAKLFGEDSYMKTASDMAKRWMSEAANEEGSLLAFGTEHTWSLKYNIVWDKLLDLNLFDEEIFQNEIKLYQSKALQYGIPLDSREMYTKLDWLVWTTVMTDDKEYFDMVIKSVYRMLNETCDRVPFTDWYYASNGRQCIFQNRSVLGGIFINLLP